MDSQFLSHIQVRFSGVTWHRWKPSQSADLPALGTTSLEVIDGALWLMLKAGVLVSEIQPDGTPGRCWEPPAGAAFLWPMSLPRRIQTPRGGEWLSVRLSATLFDRINLFDAFALPREIPLDATQYQWLRENIRQLLTLCHGESAPAIDVALMPEYSSPMMRDYATQSPLDRWIAQSLTQAIFGVCRTACAASSQPQHNLPDWLSRALEIFENEPLLGVGEVAHRVGFSSAQFRRLFQQWTGGSPQQYLHRQRMERARLLLESGDLPIGEIARQVGFSSASHFARAFKTAYHHAPVRYRQSVSRSIA